MHAVPFGLEIPWETPITMIDGQALRGMHIGVTTELEIARALDSGDLDPINVHPLPAQKAILDAFIQLGFRFKNADMERGHIRVRVSACRSTRRSSSFRRRSTAV